MLGNVTSKSNLLYCIITALTTENELPLEYFCIQKKLTFPFAFSLRTLVIHLGV